MNRIIKKEIKKEKERRSIKLKKKINLLKIDREICKQFHRNILNKKRDIYGRDVGLKENTYIEAPRKKIT